MKDEINHSFRLSLILLNNYYNMVRYLSQSSCLNELVDLVCDKQGRLIMIIIISNLNEVYKDMALTTMRLKNVSYSDGSQQILKNISGEFAPGKITTFIGPSGAGKSTLFYLLNGLLSPDQGSVFLNKTNLHELDPIELRKTVGIVMQHAIMLPGTVYDNLATVSRLHNQNFSKKEAKQLLNLVNLEEKFLTKPAKDLSGGQKQKVSIARTLANQPEVLLLDEITASLDQISAQAIEETIQAIQKKFQLTVLWITHNIDQAVRVGDQTWVIMNGMAVEQTESQKLDQSTNKRVQDFIKGESNS